MAAKRLTYLQARLLLLALGVGISIGQTLLAWDRGAAPTEVLAPVLYIPIFAGALFAGLGGGLVAAGISSVIYGVLLGEITDAIGIRLFLGLLINRTATYLLYAVVVALGSRYIEGRLRKLELYDQIDDLTTLYNSSFFLQDTDLEVGRSNRYRTIFSVIDLNVQRSVFEGFGRRRYERVIRDVSDQLQDAIRKVDRAARVDMGESDRFLLILPETGTAGADVLSGRIQEATRTFLTQRGCTVNGHVTARAITFPDQPEPLRLVREEIARVEEERRAIRTE